MASASCNEHPQEWGMGSLQNRGKLIKGWQGQLFNGWKETNSSQGSFRTTEGIGVPFSLICKQSTEKCGPVFWVLSSINLKKHTNPPPHYKNNVDSL